MSKADISEDGTPLILYGELYTTYSEVAYEIVRKTNKTVPSEYYSKIGDVIIPTSGETPEDIATATCVMLPNVILGGDLNIYRTTAVDGRVISYIIKHKLNRKISRLAQGKSVVHIGASEISQLEIHTPSIAEQKKILTMLRLIDEKISKQMLLIEHLKKYKRGVLKQILAQKIRFKSNSFEYPSWRSFSIAEITECLDRKRVPITANERIKGNYPYYGANGIQDYISDYIFDGEFVLLAEDGGHFNDFATEPLAQYVSGKIWVNNHAHVLKAHCNTKFLYYALVHKDIRNYINNPSRGKLNQEDMQNIVVDIPCEEEQKQIVLFLEEVDEYISRQNGILLSLEAQRKAVLQQMFI